MTRRSSRKSRIGADFRGSLPGQPPQRKDETQSKIHSGRASVPLWKRAWVRVAAFVVIATGLIRGIKEWVQFGQTSTKVFEEMQPTDRHPKAEVSVAAVPRGRLTARQPD